MTPLEIANTIDPEAYYDLYTVGVYGDGEERICDHHIDGESLIELLMALNKVKREPGGSFLWGQRSFYQLGREGEKAYHNLSDNESLIIQEYVHYDIAKVVDIYFMPEVEKTHVLN